MTWRQEFDACVASAHRLVVAAEGRDYTSSEMEDLLYELAAASGLLSHQPGAQSALGRALSRVIQRRLS